MKPVLVKPVAPHLSLFNSLFEGVEHAITDYDNVPAVFLIC